MKINDIKDFCNPYSKCIELIKMIDSHIYYINSLNNILCLKICSISLNKYDNDVLIDLICVPISTLLCPTYNYNDITLSLDDLNIQWFYSFNDAKKRVRKILNSNRLFDL